MPTWYIYILQCSDNTLYTGITTDLERRLHEHNHSPKGAKYTRARRPIVLVYSEPADCRSTASRREWELKQLNATDKRQLISAQSNKSG
ncbi:GIY-YIG nuclease family protein [Sedimenticola selenatireducens]|jgi:putative endonuclease|uniref:GIY-YIG nuclease family protein n=1 Tax=Sedimenticola selenatireducens TaxID=191960 RepID=A0A558DTY8_9GAMM|nr:GIY-YIG nuclease family protein [Sedimenticola selenatireducens]TVO77006.1 GIY-YIG nuclease family protein [Sedimenticola selenatireducens]TVT64449.1 MAG: GIY-YIG nuclease family protein [Sedimenticola selenatireducens]